MRDAIWGRTRSAIPTDTREEEETARLDFSSNDLLGPFWAEEVKVKRERGSAVIGLKMDLERKDLVVELLLDLVDHDVHDMTEGGNDPSSLVLESPFLLCDRLDEISQLTEDLEVVRLLAARGVRNVDGKVVEVGDMGLIGRTTSVICTCRRVRT